MSGGQFIRDLDDLTAQLEALGGYEVQRVAEWTMTSAAWGVLRHIRNDWPVDTGLSRGLWGFKKVKDLTFVVYNDAKNSVGKDYAGWVYAKGDRSRSPIAPGIVRRAISNEAKQIEDDFLERLERWLEK